MSHQEDALKLPLYPSSNNCPRCNTSAVANCKCLLECKQCRHCGFEWRTKHINPARQDYPMHAGHPVNGGQLGLFYRDLECVLVHPNAIMPSYGREGDACLDLYPVESPMISVGEQVMIDTGVVIGIPLGYEGVIRGRGGNTNNGLWTFHGTIDSNFRDSIRVIMQNRSDHPRFIDGTSKDRKAIAQIAIKPIPMWRPVQVESLSKTNRGKNMLGSSDRS